MSIFSRLTIPKLIFNLIGILCIGFVVLLMATLLWKAVTSGSQHATRPAPSNAAATSPADSNE